MTDMDLNWDGRRLLFSDGRVLWEMNVDGGSPRRVSAEDPPITHYDGCYLPDGRILCASNAAEQAVPCTGQPDVGNLHVLDADGRNEHRVTFDQDHDWNPVVLNDGRVLYTRWEYTDLPHYFSRMLFRMNPDGTGQMEYYGSGSYWPNAMYWPRPIPGHPTAVVCVVSGHHGVSRSGELLLLDPGAAATKPTASSSGFPATSRRSSRSFKTTWWAASGRSSPPPIRWPRLAPISARASTSWPASSRTTLRPGTCTWSTSSTT